MSLLNPDEDQEPLTPEMEAMREELGRAIRKMRPMSYEETMEQVRMNELLTPPGENRGLDMVPWDKLEEWKNKPSGIPRDPMEREKWLKEQREKDEAEYEALVAREEAHRAKAIREHPELAEYLLKLADKYGDEEGREEVERALGKKTT